MASNPTGLAQRRNNPFVRTNSVSPSTTAVSRPKSTTFPSPSHLSGSASPPSHTRNQSHTSIANTLTPIPNGTAPRHQRDTSRGVMPSSNTFAPSFIKSEDMTRPIDAVHGIEGENDFSGKRYVWLKDPQAAFVKGWVVEERGGSILVQCDDGTVSAVSLPPHHGRATNLPCSNEK